MDKHSVQKLDGKNPSAITDKLEMLQRLMPEAFVDGKLDPSLLAKNLNTEASTVSEDGERYGLTWPGKKLAFEEVAKQTYCTLTLDEAASSESWKESNNIFIEGENLETLRVLQKAYFNKVKMIYIDPPYNTGKDFVYHDNYRQTEEEYCDDCNVTENGHLKKAHKLNTRDSGRFHSDWLTMMHPRLFLARNLLRDDGVIFVSIDDNEVHNLRMLMNEIFGEENVTQMIWHKLDEKGNSVKKTVGNGFKREHEYILVATKSDSFVFNDRRVKPKGTFSNPDSDPRGNWFSAIISYDDDHSNENSEYYYEIQSPSGIRWARQWQVKKDEMEVLLQDKKIYFGNEPEYKNVPRLKVFENELINQRPRSVLSNFTINGTKQLEAILAGNYFDNPKPIELVSQLIEISTDKNINEIVLDFFSGSGTSAHAVMAQNAADGGNRQYICVQLPEDTPEGSEAKKAGYARISDIALERIKRAAKKVQAENPEYTGDLGVRVYRATDSHFPVWRAKSYESDAELRTAMFNYVNTLPDGTPQQRADEVLLKLGYPLTTTIVDHNGWYQADDVALVLDEQFAVERLFTDVLTSNPKTVIVLESVFKNDEEKINFDLRCTEKGIIFQTI